MTTLKSSDFFGFSHNLKEKPRKNNNISLDKSIDFMLLQMQSLIAKNVLQDRVILRTHHRGYSMSFHGYKDLYDYIESTNECEFEIFIYPENRLISVSVMALNSKSTLQFKHDIVVQGEIVGAGIGPVKNYRGLFFSTEPGNYDSNLFHLDKLIAESIVAHHEGLLPCLMSQQNDHAITSTQNQDNDTELTMSSPAMAI